MFGKCSDWYRISRMRSRSGFTIVELLIVIVVIGILAAVTAVAFNGIRERSLNSARLQEAQQVTRLVKLYKAQNGTNPPFPSGPDAVCVGTGFSDYDTDGSADCWDIIIGSARHPDSAFNTALSTIGTLPFGTRTPVTSNDGRQRLGPVFMNADATVRYWLSTSSCPVGTPIWSTAGAVQCAISTD